MKIVPSMQEKLREAAMKGRMEDIIELLKRGVNVNGASEVRHAIRLYHVC